MKAKVILLISLVFFFFNCAVTNEKGLKRVSISMFSITPIENPEVYTYIDTTKLYKAFDDPGDAYNISLTKYDYYLKFYGNGKVSGFTGFLKDTMAFINPLNAKMGYYGIKDGKFITEHYFKNPQSGRGVRREVFFKKQGDTLIMTDNNIHYKYVMIDLNPKFLIYKPDW